MDKRSDAGIYRSRIDRLQEKLNHQGTEAMIVAQNVDLYYFGGSMQTGYLVIPAAGTPIFFVRRSIARAREESVWPVEELGAFRGFGEKLREHFPAVFDQGRPPRLAAEYDVLPVQQYVRLQSAIKAEWTDGSSAVRETRMIKKADEIDSLKEAARVTDLALRRAVSVIREGMPEYELMAEIEYTLRMNGHMGLMRMRAFNQETITGMVGGGPASAMPTYFDGPAGGQGLGPAAPQSASRRPIGRNEPVLIDIGCCVNGYVADQTRTLVIGRLDEELVQAYDTAERILRETESLLTPGTSCEQLYLRSLEIAEEAGLGGRYMGSGADQVRFLGHGIGLEIDEWPVLARGFRYGLEPGMVLAVEPKFTFPGRGVVGIENTYLITEDGFEKLTQTPDGLIVLSAK